MRPLSVAGVGLWTPGHDSPAAWIERRRDPQALRPRCDILDSRIGRYTSLVTRMAVHALEQAAAQGRAPLKEVAAIFGSAYGEIRTAFDQLDMIEREGVPSPARFKNSVHNTAAGHVSIATGNMGFSTALAAGGATFAMCLLEAFAWLEARRGSVIVAVADEPLPDHLATVGRYEALGVAFCLSSDPPSGGGLAGLSDLRRRGPKCPPGGVPERLAGNPCAAALPLVEAVMRRRSGIVPVEQGGEGWSVELQVGGRAAP